MIFNIDLVSKHDSKVYSGVKASEAIQVVLNGMVDGYTVTVRPRHLTTNAVDTAAACGSCGEIMQAVRPGKWQCNNPACN